MLKKVDVAVFDTIETLTQGEFRGGVQRFDLASGGVDYSTSGGFVDDIADQLDEFKQQIIDGEIEVPTDAVTGRSITMMNSARPVRRAGAVAPPSAPGSTRTAPQWARAGGVGGSMTIPTAIELRDIVKRFPGVVANDGVDLTVRTGTVHAIVGENGAGKSTLMKTLYGAHRPDEGTVVVNGIERHFRSPADAIEAGIGMVFQHFMLADNFTVWENIVLGSEPGTPGQARRPRRPQAASTCWPSATASTSTPTTSSPTSASATSSASRSSRCSTAAPSILILDEPTAVLVPHEVDELFGSLRDLTAHGSTVIFISHKLDEVLDHADAITVIRAGRTVGEVDDPRTGDGRTSSPR